MTTYKNAKAWSDEVHKLCENKVDAELRVKELERTLARLEHENMRLSNTVSELDNIIKRLWSSLLHVRDEGRGSLSYILPTMKREISEWVEL